MSVEESVCSICQDNEPKYTCPACGMRTCSLNCVKRHKKQTECTGTVDQSKFISHKELSENSIHINRDYNFLSNFGRNIQLGKADIKSNAKNAFKRQYNGSNNNRFTKRFKTKDQQDATEDLRLAVVNKAFPHSPPTNIKRNNTLIVQLPVGMSRATSNKSGYDKKSSTFTWTIEWVLVNKEGQEQKSVISYRLKETLILRDAIPMNIANNTLGHADTDKVKIEKSQLSFFLDNIVNMNKPNKSIIKLNSEESIASALTNKILLEYPKIYVTLDQETWNEFVTDEESAYGLQAVKNKDSADTESDNESSDSSDSSESDSTSEDSDDDSDSEDERPQESSSRIPDTDIASLVEVNSVVDTSTAGDKTAK